ncbi:MAG: hypothetical protein AAGD06_18845 [Acidobacteriota bacterium]
MSKIYRSIVVAFALTFVLTLPAYAQPDTGNWTFADHVSAMLEAILDYVWGDQDAEAPLDSATSRIGVSVTPDQESQIPAPSSNCLPEDTPGACSEIGPQVTPD